MIIKPKYFAIHRKEDLKEDLWKDMHWGKIDYLPKVQPVGWLHRLVTTSEEYGGPRINVDWSTLNKLCNQEMFRTPSPFKLMNYVKC